MSYGLEKQKRSNRVRKKQTEEILSLKTIYLQQKHTNKDIQMTLRITPLCIRDRDE
jgi:hypothetical protein